MFRRAFGASPNEVGLVFSADTHYSVWKAANLLDLRPFAVPVYEASRVMSKESIAVTLDAVQTAGIRFVIAVVNMATTMFGSVDDTTYYRVYGPTIVATNEVVNEILATRAIQIVMPQSSRSFDDDLDEGAVLSYRERLVAFRARWIDRDFRKLSSLPFTPVCVRVKFLICSGPR